MVHTLADRAANGASADSETLRGQNSLFDYEENQNTDNDNGEGFENPMCVAVDPVSNRVAICDTGNSRIVVYDAYNSGVTPVAIIGRREGDAQLSQPNIKDVAIHGNFVFAAAGETLEDPDARILIYDLRNLSTEDGVPDTMYLPVGAIGQSFDGVSMPANNCNQNNSTGPDTLCNVQHLATDEMGNLWVSDTGNNRVLMFEDPAAHLQVSPTVSALEAGVADHVLGQPNMLSNSQYFGADEKTFRLIAPDNLTLTGGPNRHCGSSTGAISGFFISQRPIFAPMPAVCQRRPTRSGHHDEWQSIIGHHRERQQCQHTGCRGSQSG